MLIISATEFQPPKLWCWMRQKRLWLRKRRERFGQNVHNLMWIGLKNKYSKGKRRNFLSFQLCLKANIENVTYIFKYKRAEPVKRVYLMYIQKIFIQAGGSSVNTAIHSTRCSDRHMVQVHLIGGLRDSNKLTRTWHASEWLQKLSSFF
jgi:hypothetical protein